MVEKVLPITGPIAINMETPTTPTNTTTNAYVRSFSRPMKFSPHFAGGCSRRAVAEAA